MLPIKKKNDKHLSKTYYGGCSIYVLYTENWSRDCKVTHAEFAAAAAPVTFGCLKKQFKKGKNHWGVKGHHTLRPDGSGCGSTVVMWGGAGHGINIGNKGADDYSHLDNQTRSILETMDPTNFAPIEFGDPLDSDEPFGPLGWNATGLQYDPKEGQ